MLPTKRIGSHCENPGECPFYEYCHEGMGKDSIYELPYGTKIIPALEASGIALLRDIPNSFPLSPRQAALVESAKKERPVIDRKGVRKFLDDLTFPLYHLDFETGSWAIPPWDSSGPYEPLPFMYSLDIQHGPGGCLEHHEFIADDTVDPREALIESMISLVGTAGSLVAWNASYEQRVIKKLAERFPMYRESLEILLPRFRDPISVFRSGSYSDYRIGGSASLKAVLPALVPQMSYDAMEIKNGDMASLAYQRFIDGDLADDDWQRQRQNLCEYCHMDTAGMANVVDKLYQTVKAI
jgi:hypothetical protein